MRLYCLHHTRCSANYWWKTRDKVNVGR